jgi:hypothetical protein
MRRAVVLEVHLEVLPGQDRRLAAVGTGDGEAAALGVMGREGVEDELLVAVATGHEPLGALAQLVLAEVTTLHLHAALVLAVEGLVAARADVLLKESGRARILVVAFRLCFCTGRARPPAILTSSV